jgi:hypothetical protein
MHLTSYAVVFDAGRAGYRTWELPLCGLIPVVIGALQALRQRNDRSRSSVQATIPTLLVAVGCSWVVLGLLSSYAEYSSLVAALHSGSYTTVEGVVEAYSPQGSGRAPERWTVAGHEYWLPYGGETENDFSEPAVVHAGDHVRIADVRGRIARLEIARP